MSLSGTYLSSPKDGTEESPLCKCAAGAGRQRRVNLLGPDVALRLSHVNPGYWTHLSSRKQELEHRTSPCLRALGASLLFSIFILVTELFAQKFYTGGKERKNKELLWLKKTVGEGVRVPPAPTTSLPWRPPRGSYLSSYCTKLC